MEANFSHLAQTGQNALGKRQYSQTAVMAGAIDGNQPHKVRKRRNRQFGPYQRHQMHMQAHPGLHPSDINRQFNNNFIHPDDHSHLFLLGHPEDDQRPQPYPRTIPDFDSTYADDHIVSAPLENPTLPLSINRNEDPWAPIRDDGPQNIINMTDIASVGSVGHSSVITTPQPFGGPQSFVASSVTGSQLPQDSGYGSARPLDARSTTSWDRQSSNQGCGGITERMFEMQFPQDHMVSEMEHSLSQENAYPVSVETLTCQKCIDLGKESPNFRGPPDYKKHMLKHEKPFRCGIEGCEWSFTTANDLQRHKSSVHNIYSAKYYYCAAPGCPKKNKAWPRADNFRQHVKKLHPTLNLQEIMEKSEGHGRSVGESKFGAAGSQLPQDLSFHLKQSLSSHLVSPQNVNSKPLSGNVSLNCNSHERSPQVYSVEGGSRRGNPSSSLAEPKPCQPVKESGLPSNHVGISRDIGASHQDSQPTSSPKRPSISRGRRSATPYPEPVAIHSIAMRNQDRRFPKSDHSSSRIPSDEDRLKIALDDLVETSKGFGKEQLEQIIKDRLRQVEKGLGPFEPIREESDLENPYPCPSCNKRKKSQCELNKHLKRHTRPYGCTDKSCSHNFGSIHDWKRHENSMHYRAEYWLCQQPHLSKAPHEQPNRPPPKKSSRQKVKMFFKKDKSKSAKHDEQNHSAPDQTYKFECSRVFLRREKFRAHLLEDHSVSEDEANEQCNSQRVDRNRQLRFYCGFCRRLIPLRKKGHKAWDERCDHIHWEHFHKGMNVKQWVSEGESKTNGELLEERENAEDSKREVEEKVESEKDGWSDGEEEEGERGGGEEGGEDSPSPQLLEDIPSSQDVEMGGVHDVPTEPEQNKPNPEPTPTEQLEPNQPSPDRSKNQKRWEDDLWYCPNCGHGPLTKSIQSICLHCDWRRK